MTPWAQTLKLEHACRLIYIYKKKSWYSSSWCDSGSWALLADIWNLYWPNLVRLSKCVTPFYSSEYNQYLKSVSVLGYTVSSKWELHHVCTFNQGHLTERLVPLSTSQTLVSVSPLNLFPASTPPPNSLLSDPLSHYDMMQRDETWSYWRDRVFSLIWVPCSCMIFITGL